MLGDADLVRWFLAHGADPNAESHHGLTPFLKAVQERPLATVRLLHEAGSSLAIAIPFVCSARAAQVGETEADGAARRLEVLRYLLDNGADLEAPMWFVFLFFSFPFHSFPNSLFDEDFDLRCGNLRNVRMHELYFGSKDFKSVVSQGYHVSDAVHRAHNKDGRGNDFDYGTGLNRAIVKRAENLAEELLRRGARTDSKTMNIASRGETAFELAAKYTPRLVPLVAERRKEEELASGRGAP